MSSGDLEALLRVTAPDYRGESMPDVAVGSVEAPVGDLVIGVTARGVVACSYEDEIILTERISKSVSAFVGPDPRRLDPVRRELDAYFAGRLRQFSTPVDLRLASQFGRAVFQALASVPYGATVTCAAVAEQIGRPQALRAVVNALVGNPVCLFVPCHRVVTDDRGAARGYAGGAEAKEFLLRLESATPAS